MSSGVGFFTDKGRCYNRWVEFIRCKDSTSLPFQDCVHQMEDYQECLHHRKEKDRMIKVIREIERQIAEKKNQ